MAKGYLMDAQQKVTEASKIQCLECGKWFRALPTHVLRSHGMDDDDYRIKHGVPKATPLVCKDWSDRASNTAKTNPRIREASRKFTRMTKKGVKHKQSRTAKAQRRQRDVELHRKGTAAAAKVDRTKERREKIAPYPVSVSEVCQRLDVSKKSAYSFLHACTKSGTLVRVSRGTYDLPGGAEKRSG